MRRGYSLIECLTVLTIIAILAAAGFPALQGYLQRSHDQFLQQQLVQMIRFAQQSADARSSMVGMKVVDNTLLVFTQDTKVLYRQQLNLYGGKLCWRSYPFYRAYFSFNPRTDAVNDNGAFWYCRPQQAKPAWAVMVASASEVHVVQPNEGGVIRDSRGRDLVCG